MSCCTPKCLKWTIFGFGITFTILGIILTAFWIDILQAILRKQLSLSADSTIEYKMWKKTPIPIYTELYLFNISNAQDLEKDWTVKPVFAERGPYTFSETDYHTDVIRNTNHTLTFKNKRVWNFDPERTQGSLDDSITCFNPLILILGEIVRTKHVIVRIGINYIITKKNVPLFITRRAGDLLFDGYADPLMTVVGKLPFRHIILPFNDKFGWFYKRNDSSDYDGVFNMYDGSDDLNKLGRYAAWNYKTTAGAFDNECDQIKGTSGELWYPVKEDTRVEVFATDICSTLPLVRDGTETLHGVTGHKFVATELVFDNGRKYPEMACYGIGEEYPSGIRNVSACKFGAPLFVSFPHFYLADPSYNERIAGLSPDPKKHSMFIALEPTTGIPLQASVALQLNFHLQAIDRIVNVEHVQDLIVPLIWFKETATLDDHFGYLIRLLVSLPDIGVYTGYACLGVGVLCLIIFTGVMLRRFLKKQDKHGDTKPALKKLSVESSQLSTVSPTANNIEPKE